MIKKVSKYGYIEFEVGNDENIWFTSDHHFFHKNIIRLCNRPFVDIKEMSEKLIENWNTHVKPNDIVFNLGDFCWSGSSDEWIKLMDKLHGKQILIIGNHDDRKCVEKVENWYKPRENDCRAVQTKLLFVRERLELRYGKKRYILDHFPQYNWMGCHYWVYNIHGHIHEKNSEIARVNSYNVSVERNEYRPISLKELNLLLDQQKEENSINLCLIKKN